MAPHPNLRRSNDRVYRTQSGSFAVLLQKDQIGHYWHIVAQNDADVRRDGYRANTSHDGWSYYSPDRFDDVSEQYEYWCGNLNGTAIDAVLPKS
jgi:hypothetical protein